MSLQMIPTDKIDIDVNVRTNYPIASIIELSESIEEDRLMYPPAFQEKDGRFKLKIGGRRYRALMLKNPTEIPGFVGDMTEDQWERLQLIENIQREDLPAKDLINAVWRLYEKNGHDLTKTAREAKKKKPWVSKKIAVKMKAGPLTAKLLEADIKDTELLYAFTKLETIDMAVALELMDGVIGRTIGREDVRTALKAAAAGGVEAEEQREDTTGNLFTPEPPEFEDGYKYTNDIKLPASNHSAEDVRKAFEWLRKLATKPNASNFAQIAFDEWAAMAGKGSLEVSQAK